MAVTVGELAVALRITTDPAAEVPEPERSILERLQSWAEAEIQGRAPGAPGNARDQALVVLAGYVYDRPTTQRGSAYANAWENSGTADILRRWVQRRGVILEHDTGQGSQRQEAPGQAPGNPVDQGAVRAIVDQEVEPWAHRDNPDLIPDAKLPDPPTVPDVPDVAPWAHQGNPDPIPDSKLPDPPMVPDVATWAEADNPDLIPDAKLPSRPAALPLGASVPAPPRAMRIGWAQDTAIVETVFVRAGQHPIDGVAVGTTAGTDAPPAPPAIDTDPTLYMAVWIAGAAVDATRIHDGPANLTDAFTAAGALTVEGVAGHVYVSAERLRHATRRRISVVQPGSAVLGAADVEPWALTRNPDAVIPAAKLPGRDVLYQDTSNYRRSNTSAIFRLMRLTRDPVRGRGLLIVLRELVSGDSRVYPLDCGMTDDWLDLPSMTLAQQRFTINGATVEIDRFIVVKTPQFGEAHSDAFGHGTVYVGRVTDSWLGFAFAQTRGLSTWRFTILEVP